ncbi:monocarboxylate transporter 12-B-like [Mytilus trossulus]|uniref:monocarboxylate transporter 12-B-like n=1 Tax=Mytilus trossulus TaxID=6551 RepID=UPI0030077D07
MYKNVTEITIPVDNEATDDQRDVEKEQLTGNSDFKSHFSLDYIQDKDIYGGWAWKVLAGATLTFCVFGATMKGFGVFFNGFIDRFNASSVVTSMISGVLHTTYSICTLPVLTVGLRYLTTRQCVIIASILCSGAFIGGSFASSIDIIVITNGFMAGLAFTFCHGPLMYLTGVYFMKRRNLAQAVAVSGFTFGGLIFPPIYSYLIKHYGLQGGMLITGGMQLNLIAFSLLLRPKIINEKLKSKNEIDGRDITQPGSSTLLKNNNIFKEQQYAGRKRSISLNIPKARIEKIQLFENAYSEQHLATDANKGSLTKIIDTLSNSNVSRVLSECTFSISLLDFHDKPVPNDSNQSIEKDCSCKNKLVDFSLFKKPFMWIYALVYCFGRVPAAYLSIFIAPLAREMDTDSSGVAILVALVNACDFIGMVMCGVITDRKIIKNHVTVIVTLSLTSVCLMFTPLCKEFWHFVLLCIVSGIGAGGIFALTPPVLVDFLGLENFRSAMGILVLLQGVSLGMSAPFMGFLRDVTGTYVTSFYFMAGCDFLAATIFVIGLYIIRKINEVK